MEGTVFLNGRFVQAHEASVPLDDRGLLFGDGVYEVYRTYGARPFRHKEHLDRLRRSAGALRITLPEPDWTAVHHALVQRNALETGEVSVYIQLTRGAPLSRKHAFPPTGTAPTLFAVARALAPLAEEVRASGVSIITTPDIRWGRCDIKSVNLLPNVLANQAAAEAGAWEAVFVKDGFVTEGSHTNVFAVVDGELRTHPEGPGILGGITRQVILEVAGGLGLVVHQRPVTVDEFRGATEVFLTGTTAEVLPVVRCDGRPVGSGHPGPIADRLLAAFRAAAA